MEYVKICGLKEYEHIELCIDNGADAVGFIYNVPSSPRNLQKSELKSLLIKIAKKILTVIVVKPSSIFELKELMNDIDASYFQIHINFDFQELDKLSNEYKEKLILALKVNQINKESVIKKIKQFHDQIFAFLIDNSEGHGTKFDFDLVREILRETNDARIILAGGIDINNIEKITKNLKSYGIDVSSSLELEKGVKDPIKIKNFLEKIKEIKNNL